MQEITQLLKDVIHILEQDNFSDDEKKVVLERTKKYLEKSKRRQLTKEEIIKIAELIGSLLSVGLEIHKHT